MEKMTDQIMPLVPLRGLTVVPNMIIHFDLSRDVSKGAIEQALNTDQKVLLVPQTDPDIETPDMDTIYKMATLAVVRQVTKLPNNIDRVMVEGVARARILNLYSNDGKYYTAEFEMVDESENTLDPYDEEALIRSLRDVFDTYVRFYPKVGKGVNRYFKENSSLEVLINQILINTPFT
jgi:ATP-dependent Lon protease